MTRAIGRGIMPAMQTLAIAIGAGLLYLVAYHTYGRYLARRIFRLDPHAPVPSVALNDDADYVPTAKSVVFGHHFTSIAGTGPIVGPAIAVMWGWLPALLWVLFGSILIGAVHDFGSLIVSMRNRGQTVGDIAGRVLNKRVRLLFLFVLFMALTIVLAIFGLVIAAVFRQYPAAIFPCMVQIPIAVVIGVWLHRKGVNLLVPSILALAIMYLTVIYGDWGPLHAINQSLAAWPTIRWVGVLLVYSYVASVLPVWALLQPRDYINSLQLLSALGLIVAGLFAAAMFGGAPPVEGADRVPLELAAPAIRLDPPGAPAILPFLFITVACGAISGFHCLVSSGTSSKQLRNECDAQFVGYGSMLTEGFLAVIVILACVAGLGLGIALPDEDPFDRPAPAPMKAGGTIVRGPDHLYYWVYRDLRTREIVYMCANKTDGWQRLPPVDRSIFIDELGVVVPPVGLHDSAMLESLKPMMVGAAAYNTRYAEWGAAGGLTKTVGAFVDGSANFLKALGMPPLVAVALMGVLVASFAGTTMDTACRLQRYVVQELAGTLRVPGPSAGGKDRGRVASRLGAPLAVLQNKHGATIFAIVIAGLIAAMPNPGAEWSIESAGKGGLILWPLFGATNQLLAGLSFLVIFFYLWRRGVATWWLWVPMAFMLVMPAWAMLSDLPNWIKAESPNWPVIVIAIATLALEAWMVVEALLLWPRVRGVLEESLPPLPLPRGATIGYK